MSGGEPYYLTTPIYYVNDSPHIGHAYTTVACDVLARFMRLDGRDVHVPHRHRRARPEGRQIGARRRHRSAGFLRPRLAEFPRHGALMNISNDDFIRTTEPRHIAACQALWQRAARRKRRDLSRQVRRLVLGARRGVLRRGASWSTGRGARTRRRSRMGRGARVISSACRPGRTGCSSIYERHPDFIAPRARRNEVVSFVKGGLHDLSISRTSFNWGIPVPGNPKHVMYVWLDALTNYITAVGYPDTDERSLQALLAGRPAHGRQGHRALPLRLLAGLPDGRRAARRRSASSPMAGGPSRARRCRSRSATSSRRSSSSTHTASMPCAISCCASCRSAATAISRTAPWSTASTATSPTISAIWRSACCR